MASARLGGLDGLGHITPGSGPDHGDHVLGLVGHRQSEELDVGVGRSDPLHDSDPAAVGHVHVDQHDRRLGGADLLDRGIDVVGRPDDRRTPLPTRT